MTGTERNSIWRTLVQDFLLFLGGGFAEETPDVE
jgi:hypothetical protein